MAAISSIRLHVIITLLLCISSMPVLGQISSGDLISGSLGFVIEESIDESYYYYYAIESCEDAYTYYNSGYYVLALTYINKSIEYWEQLDYLEKLPWARGSSSQSGAWDLKGLILDKLGRYEEAISCFDNALKIDPGNVYAWTNKGITYYNLGNYEKAIECYDSAIVKDPSYIYAYTQKNIALSALQSSSSPQENTHDGTAYAFVVEGGAGHGGFAFAMPGYSSGCIDGSGNVIFESRDVDKFDSIDLEVPGNLYITQGENQPLRIEGDDNILQVLLTDVVDDKLIVDSDECIRPTNPINIYVSAKEIRRLNSGSGKIISQSQINSDTLEVDITGSGSSDLILNVSELNTAISGSGDIYLNGAAKVHNSEISGSGNVRAFDLSTEMTDITVSGSGNAQINVLENLEVDILGSGVVFYKGDATVSQNILGSGKLIKS